MSEEGKVALITGAASGIGLATARMMADKGVKLVLADRDMAGATSLAKDLKDAGKTAIDVECDVANWDQQVATFDTAVTEFGRIDYVLPIAGVGERRWLKKGQTEKWTKPDLTVIDVDLTAPLWTVALAVQQFRRQDKNEHGFRGKIMAVASVCGIYCIPTLPVYTAAKHGMVGLTRSYGKYLVEEGMTMNSICPNVVKTHISTEAFYDRMEKEGLLCDMQGVLQGFEDMMGASKMSGECLEISPSKVGYTARKPPEALDDAAFRTLAFVEERTKPHMTP